jgi:hypothetical protein
MSSQIMYPWKGFLTVQYIFSMYNKIHKQQKRNEIIKLVQHDLMKELKKIVPDLPDTSKFASIAHTVMIMISKKLINVGLSKTQLENLKLLLAHDVIMSNGQKGGSREYYLENTRSKWDRFGRTSFNLAFIIEFIIGIYLMLNTVTLFNSVLSDYKIPVKVNIINDVDITTSNVEETSALVPFGYKPGTEDRKRQLDIEHVTSVTDIGRLLFPSADTFFGDMTITDSLVLKLETSIEDIYTELVDETKKHITNRFKILKESLPAKLKQIHQSIIPKREAKNIIEQITMYVRMITYNTDVTTTFVNEQGKAIKKRMREDEIKFLKRFMEDYATQQTRNVEDTIRKLNYDLSTIRNQFFMSLVFIFTSIPLSLWFNNKISTKTLKKLLYSISYMFGTWVPFVGYMIEMIVVHIVDVSIKVKSKSSKSSSSGIRYIRATGRMGETRKLAITNVKGGNKTRRHYKF